VTYIGEWREGRSVDATTVPIGWRLDEYGRPIVDDEQVKAERQARSMRKLAGIPDEKEEKA
jgi:hypothetical protein